jgi:ABC-2 type transport system permease protein
MNTIWLLMKREFNVRVRTRGFVIFTVIGLLAIVGLAFAPAIIDAAQSGSQLTVAFADETAGGPAAGRLFERLQADLVDRLPNGDPRYKLAASEASRAELDAQVKDGSLDAYLWVTSGEASAEAAAPGQAGAPPGYTAVLVSNEALGGQDVARLTAALNAAAVYTRLEMLGVSTWEAAGLFAPVVMQTQTLGESGSESESERAQSIVLTYVLVLLLYFAVITYGTYVAMGVIEEKSSRVVEVLLSAVRPFQLMAGKLLGIGLAALTQCALWIAGGVVVFALRSAGQGVKVGGLTLQLSAVSPGVLVWFAVFFVFGFFTYSAVLAGGSSLVSRAEDAQQVTTPVMIPLVGVFMASLWAMGNPDSSVTVALSFVPFASPLLMFVRIAMTEPPLWQILVAVLINLLAIAGLIAAAAKIFRGSILHYGQKVRLSTVARAFRRG